MSSVQDIINQIKAQHEVYLLDLTTKANENLNALRDLLKAGTDSLKIRVVEDKSKRVLDPDNGDKVTFKIDIHNPSSQNSFSNPNLGDGSNILPHLINSFGTRKGLIYNISDGYVDNWVPGEDRSKSDHTKIAEGDSVKSIKFTGSSKDFLDMLNSALTSYGLDIKDLPARPSLTQLRASK